MPVAKSKQGKPAGGIGAENQSTRTHSLVMDDRLFSKQYVTRRIEAKISDDAFGSGWDAVTTEAPSKNAIYDKINSLAVTSDVWTRQSSATSAKVRANKSGNYGIGDENNLSFDDITEKLYVDGNIKSTGDLIVGDDLSLLSDSAVLNFGANSDTTLTHTIIGAAEGEAGLILNSTNKICFNDTSQFIQGTPTVLKVGATDEIDLTATTIDMNGAADISGALNVGGELTVAGNLTVQGTATSLTTETITMNDNIVVLNYNASGSASVDAGLEIERGDDANTRLVWDESADKWSVQPNIGAETYYPIITTGDTTTVTNTMLAGSIANAKLSNSAVTIGSTAISLGASSTTIAGLTAVTVAGTSGSSGTTALTITGGDSSASNAAVSITGHLEADTKSFNIPHPLDGGKRLVYGCLEGPEYGMYARGSFDIEDERRKVAIDLPNYWYAMVDDDYTINLTSYGNYNVWISESNENGFWVETNAEDKWSFDWSAIGKRLDAKLEVEPNA